MNGSFYPWLLSRAAIILVFASLGSMRAGDLDPKAVGFQNLDQVKWVESRNGASASALISGDPAKEGSLYVQLMKWHPHHNSTPHYHPHDRFITVLSGTWWVGTGTNYDMNTATAMKPGTVVTDYANGIHYDGAKDEECVLVIVGIGPATTIPAAR
ncbi:MAG TPA: cupin domain-containing protein [Bryobacteraceae bacterium]|jgi:quercetin dioxygenase-like cupin family protein|nr:cupin domain-containing protein [Bryobacteraceae bacterium]